MELEPVVKGFDADATSKASAPDRKGKPASFTAFNRFITDVFLTVVPTAGKSEVNTQPVSQAKRPLGILQKATNKQVSVRLKSELEYRGKMSNVDPYMNVILVDAEESENGSKVATYGKVVIRGNNVLYIRIEDKI